MLWGNQWIWPGVGVMTPGIYAGWPGLAIAGGGGAGWGKVGSEGAASKFGKPWVWG